MAGDGFKIAEAYVDINARMDGRKIKRTIEGGLREAGLHDAGKTAGKEIGDGIDDAVNAKVKGTGKKVSDEFKKSGNDSSSSFGKGFSGIVGIVGEVASTSVKLFSDIFNFRTPLLTVAALSLALMALPILASAITVAMVGAFGGAFASIGLIAAAHNDEVKRSFAQAWGEIKAAATTISQPFLASLKRVAEEWSRTFLSLAPHLESAFRSMAPHIDNFTAGFGTAIRRLIPAIGPVTEAFNVLLDKLGQRLPDLFTTIADSVIALSGALERNPGVVDVVINTFQLLIDIVTNVTVAFSDFTGWVQRNTQLVGSLFVAITALINPLSALAVNMTGVTDSANPVDAAVKNMNATFDKTIDTLVAANAGTQEWSLSLDQLADRNLTTEQAALRFDQAVLKMTDSITANGHSLDSTTKKGAENKDALLTMASAANKAKDTFIEQGLSQDEVRNKSIAMRDEMVRQAEKLGFTRGEAQKLIDKYFAIPDKVETNVSAPGADATKGKADTVRGAVERIPKNVQVALNAVDNATNVLSAIKGTIESIARQIWVNVTAIFSEDGNIVNFANGTENHVAQIAGAGAMRVWAEPETGGEAYIPLAPSKRDRSESILQDVASRFGLTVGRRMADGGLLNSVGAASPGGKGGVQIGSLNVSVNLAGVWDFTDPSQARRIADKIAPAIREAIRVDERRFQ